LSLEPSAFSLNVIDGKASLMCSHFYYVEKLLVRYLSSGHMIFSFKTLTGTPSQIHLVSTNHRTTAGLATGKGKIPSFLTRAQKDLWE
jgi:hypothetical protein